MTTFLVILFLVALFLTVLFIGVRKELKKDNEQGN